MRPKPIANILSDLMARRGYAREQSTSSLLSAWQTAAGPELSTLTRPGNVKRGVLEVLVANSTLVQELTYQKTMLLKKLAAAAADTTIRDLRFRVGPLA